MPSASTSPAIPTRGWCAKSPLERVRLRAEVERLQAEVGVLREELRIKDARLDKVPSRERPHYAPRERMAILLLLFLVHRPLT